MTTRDRDRGDEEPGPGDRRARRRRAAASAYQMPKPATTSPISSFVVIASAAKTAKGSEPVLVQVPEGEEQERAGERDGVELVQRQPLGRRVEQVGEREAEPGPLGAEVLAGEPEDGQRADRDRDRL